MYVLHRFHIYHLSHYQYVLQSLYKIRDTKLKYVNQTGFIPLLQIINS